MNEKANTYKGFAFVLGSKNVQKEFLKVSGNLYFDHNQRSIVQKQNSLQLLFYFSVQIETENNQLIYESQFATLSSGVKFTLNLAHYMTIFEFQFLEAKRFFTYPWFQFVRIKISKKLCPRFLITFSLFEILAYISFLFPLKSVLKVENPS